MNLEEKVLSANYDHEMGFNCAQSVFKQYCEALGMDVDTALALTSGFGGGMRIGTVCGALTGGLMVIGLAKNITDPAHKTMLDPVVLELISRFRVAVGEINCRDIIGYDVSDPSQRAAAKMKGIFEQKCPIAIEASVRIVYDMLNRDESA